MTDKSSQTLPFRKIPSDKVVKSGIFWDIKRSSQKESCGEQVKDAKSRIKLDLDVL